MSLGENRDGAAPMIMVFHRIHEHLGVLWGIRKREIAKHHDEILEPENRDRIIVGDDVIPPEAADEALREETIADLSVIAVNEITAEREFLELFPTHHFDAPADFAHDPKDRKSQQVIGRIGKELPNRIPVDVLEALPERFALDVGARKLVIEEVIVINDFLNPTHSFFLI